MTAQCLLFFVAGFETSSLTLTYTVYELAHQPHIQQKLQSEIDRVLNNHNGEVTYEALQEMTYMDKVVSGKSVLEWKEYVHDIYGLV